MKKTAFVIAALIAFSVTAWAQQQSGIINGILKKNAEDKVAKMKELIGFDDDKAKQLSELEFQFLLDVQKVENCCLCNKKKRIEKLKQKRDTELQKVLTREQYIKYDAIENDRIKKHPLWTS